MTHPVVDGPPIAGSEPEKPRDTADKARRWLALLEQSDKTFRAWHNRADRVDALYADLEKLAAEGRDRQFQMFWANVQVLAPSIYARPPVPVVTPRFQDRRPVHRVASELLERSVAVAFDGAGVDGVMRLVRDDMVVPARGCAWVRKEDAKDGRPERVCIEHVHRRDFRHDPARNWSEVDWVAKRSWMTRDALADRFRAHSGDLYLGAAMTTRKSEDTGEVEAFTPKAGVWEIWSRSDDRVYWVAEGCDALLDDGEPHLRLDGYFPCPRPAYGTLKRGTLQPVPDMAFYKDQLEEINELTARIAALSDAVKVRAFYPAGVGEIADAIETAIRATSDNAMMVPVSNWAMIGSGSVKDMMVWLPIDMIVKAIRELTEMRRQLIEDVYQITGLSDIMRGSTEASETLGAQQLKSQYGSVRIRDRQEELVRFARDLTRIVAEIMAEGFDGGTLEAMSQMELLSDKDVKARIAEIVAQVQRMAADPQMQAMVQQDPGKAQGMAEQAKAAVAKLEDTVTIEAVMRLLRDQLLRPFVLDIETDSTITPDENAQKQRATEYLTAMGGLLNQAVPMLQAFPQAAPLVAETIRFAQSQFRVGRQMDGVVEEFAEAMKAVGSQPKAPDPAAGQAQADAAARQADMQAKQQDSMLRQQETAARIQAESEAAQLELQGKAALMQREGEVAQLEAQARLAEIRATQQLEADRHGREMQSRDADLALKQLDLQIRAATAVRSAASAPMEAV